MIGLLVCWTYARLTRGRALSTDMALLLFLWFLNCHCPFHSTLFLYACVTCLITAVLKEPTRRWTDGKLFVIFKTLPIIFFFFILCIFCTGLVSIMRWCWTICTNNPLWLKKKKKSCDRVAIRWVFQTLFPTYVRRQKKKGKKTWKILCRHYFLNGVCILPTNYFCCTTTTIYAERQVG